MKHLFFTVTVLAAFVSLSPRIRAGQRLTIRVSPTVAMAPAVLTIKTTVEPSDANRTLSIEIDSATYHRSMEIPLDGRNAPRINIVELKDVPTGLHEVRAVLVGSDGPIANTMQLVKVEPSAGSR
jgi:hypothetical protein